MDRACLLVLATAACGGGGGGGDKVPLEVSTTFTVDTTLIGMGPSPLDPLAGQQVSIDVQLIAIDFVQDTTDTCHTQTVYVQDSIRTASGPTGDLVQSQILDMLPAWDVDLQVCTDGSAVLAINGDVDGLNTRFDCSGVPSAVTADRDANGFPFLTSFTGTNCTSDILDVINNRDLTAENFAVTVTTGPAHLP